jgi:large subunit ribosomal protein L15
MIDAGLCRPKALVKVLGQGALSRPIRVSAHAFSASAAAAITTAGGSVEKMPLPFGNGRPPASGNALMNR